MLARNGCATYFSPYAVLVHGLPTEVVCHGHTEQVLSRRRQLQRMVDAVICYLSFAPAGHRHHVVAMSLTPIDCQEYIF